MTWASGSIRPHQMQVSRVELPHLLQPIQIGDFRLGSLGLDQAIDAPLLKRPVDVNRGQAERIGETPSVQAYAPTTGWSALGRTRKSSPFSEQPVFPA